jgi:hypothetical protein
LDYFPSGDVLGGGTLGFGTGGLVALGDGCGGGSSADLVGEGEGAGFFVFELSFALSLALRFTPPISAGLSVAAGEAEVLALMFAVTG